MLMHDPDPVLRRDAVDPGGVAPADATIPFRTRSAVQHAGPHPAESLLRPLALVVSLWAATYVVGGRLDVTYLLISAALLWLALPWESQLQKPVWRFARDLVPAWACIAVLVVLLARFGAADRLAPDPLLLAWAAIAFPCQVLAHGFLRWAAPSLARRMPRRAVIAGLNEDGIALARQISRDPCSDMRLVGYFDDRSPQRVPEAPDVPGLRRLGSIDEMPEFAARNQVDVVYLCLPMVRQSRVVSLLERLCDTTVSIYFVPKLKVTELMSGRVDALGEVAVISVCETPFRGFNAFVKRASDIVLAVVVLVLTAPLMLAIAIAVRLESPGPVIFRQRRYGLNGEEIMVWKFRSMKVCEDGEAVRQATRDDDRVTRVGALLRRTSLDELPQFFNVLQGTMSVVGPRPHAVAHNELYRKAIRGYMLRHKVRPGITGWAQVNGCRGETETVEKMKQRIEYDLAYMRNWSLALDLYIVFKTAFVIFGDRRAY